MYLETGTCIIVPLCPDYIPLGISDGVSNLMMTALTTAQEIQTKYPRTSFCFLIADTESDIITNFNREHIFTSLSKFAIEMNVLVQNSSAMLFSEFCTNWHELQYDLEHKIQAALSEESELLHFLESFFYKRMDRYRTQYGINIISDKEAVRRMQIRHYAQYMLLAELMLQKGYTLLMNYQTENLRAITKHHTFLPRDKRIELVVY